MNKQEAARSRKAPPRLALTKRECAQALGVSVDSLERHIMGELKIVRRGSLRLIPVREVEAFLERNAQRILD